MGVGIVITSGKGGTGKTTLSGGIGMALAALGHKVLCIDADVGLRNLDITLGMTDTVLMDFSDVIAGRCELSLAAAQHPTLPSLYLLTAPLSLPEDFDDEAGFSALLQEAKESFDYVLIDSPAGVGRGFRRILSGADRAIVTAVSDPASLRDAGRVTELLSGMETVHLVVNRVQRSVLRRTHATIDDAMDAAGLPLLGLVPEDKKVLLHLPPVPGKGAEKAFSNIARRLTGEDVPLMRIR